MLKLNSSLRITWKIFWRILLFFLVWGLLLSLFIVPLGSKISKWQKTNPFQVQLYSDIIAALTILAATWIMLRFIDHRPLKSIGFSFSHFFRDLSAGLVIGVAWIGVSIGFALLFGFILPVAPVGFSWYVLAGLSISMLFNVVTQELLLCGFILQTVRNQSNTVIAIIVSSFLFASYHAGAFKGEWLPVVNVFAAGVLFCIAYIITNNLWLPIFIHFAWDVLLGPVFGLTESGITNLGGGWKMFQLKGPSLFTGGSFGLEGGLIVTFTVILIISLLYYYHSKKNTPYSRPQII
jgi:hypothetical protein